MSCPGQPRERRLGPAALAAGVGLLMAAHVAARPAPPATEPSRPQAISAAALQQAIDRLGDLDDAVRVQAARTIRRVPAPEAVPALVQAVLKGTDQYVRYKALVLLTGFGGPEVRRTVGDVIQDRNDRLRTVAYAYDEHHPDPDAVFALLAAADRETGEFVRPALLRALAAHGRDPQVRPVLLAAVQEGAPVLRSAAIEALGDYRAAWAVDALIPIARQAGPFQDDAILALGKIGDRRALGPIVGLQQSAGPDAQPILSAAICLLGLHCASHLGYLDRTLRFAEHTYGYQLLLRAAVRGLVALGERGDDQALTTLLSVGTSTHQDDARATIALGVATIALRNPPFLLKALGTWPDRVPAIDLMADGFDMVGNDYEKEQFYVTARHAYWAAAEGSPTRQLMASLIDRLDF
ncbi:MAG: HEAT repeat domain-containing protein [Acidobacteriota bacterium]|nr:HEAT repeat domain-containing protein [Acidobacteriota bacterium]